MSAFVHLHTHSEYSLLDGASRTKDMVRRAKELNMPALALTDHGVMYGIVEFYEAALKEKIKPIVGCEVYVAPKNRFDKSPRKEDSPFHLVLLAQNNEGYKNLMRLSSLGFTDGFYYKPRVDKEVLKQYHQGLIALSGCLSGEVARLIQARKIDKAKDVAREYQAIFGKENFFLEIQNHNLEEQKYVNQELVSISKDISIPLVATNDNHYTFRSDHVAHDVLLCIQTGSTIDEEGRLRFSSEEFYLKSRQEMENAFPELPEALDNTLEIAERCNVEIDFGNIYLPRFEVPEGSDLYFYLEELCEEGLKKRYEHIGPEIKERLQHELEVIKQTGFGDYFLVVWDFVNFARKHGIRVGPGRGSAAGSIVSYALGITNLDPIKYGLLFERFLNPERITMPDIDIDFCYERRDEVIDYVTRKYGREKVAQIITFGTMAARAATRDAGRVFNIPYGQVDKIAKLIPETPGVTIEDALRVSAPLSQEYEQDEITRKIIDTARALEGLSRQDSIHAAGVVISVEDLTNYAPIQRKGDAETVTQYCMDDIKKIGLLKMDFLGLRTLTVIGNALHIIERTQGKEINIDNVDFEDQKTFQMLRKGDSIGVFQLESSGMRSLLKDLQPSTFEDVINLLALYRPGPLASNMVKDFVDRRHGRQPISYLHPLLEPILKDTYGIIVYQEQVMKIASELAGFTLSEADILRGAMSKKKPEVLAEQREKFIGGAISNEIDENRAGEIFDLMVHFAGYGFNRSHSAAYAVISFQTSFLKAHYPVEFMAALLTSIMGNKDKVAQYINECRRVDIKILPPDVNESFRNFTAVGSAGQGGQSIRFGLSAVRNIGDNAIGSIIEARKNKGDFTSLQDFCEKVDLSVINKRALESLIKCGAFDFSDATRKYLLRIYEQAIEAGIRRQKDIQTGQFTFFDLSGSGEAPELSGFQVSDPEAKEEFVKDQLLSYEKEMLGLYVSDHPLLGLEDLLRVQTNASLAELAEKRDGITLWVGGIVTNVSRITTKKGDIMLFLGLEDLEGSAEVVVFPTIYQKYRELLEEDKTLRIKGRLDLKEDERKIIAQEIQLLDQKTVESSSAPLYIRVPVQSFSRQLITDLKGILQTHPGPCPVFLQLRDGRQLTTLKLGVGFKIKPQGGLFAELKELLGEDAAFLQN